MSSLPTISYFYPLFSDVFMKLKNAVRLFLLTMLLSSCHAGRFFYWNFPDWDDYKRFPERSIEKPEQCFYFFEDQQDKIVLPERIHTDKGDILFEDYLKETKTLAFLVIRNDSILFEEYPQGDDASLAVNSFSTTKSYVSAMVGIAMMEGDIESTNDPFTKYMKGDYALEFDEISLQDLLDMKSGLKFNEGYSNPFGDVAKYYYGNNLNKYIETLKIKEPSGQHFEYISLNTQLLGEALEQATGKTMDAYLYEKIWQPLGMEYAASWSIDSRKNAQAKAFCCLNATARDFAKFGRLYLNGGEWNDQEIVPYQWVKTSTDIQFPRGRKYGYKNQWWGIRKNQTYEAGLLKVKPFSWENSVFSGNYFTQGHLGQFIFVSPQKNIIIVRLGKKMGPEIWPDIMEQIVALN